MMLSHCFTFASKFFIHCGRAALPITLVLRLALVLKSRLECRGEFGLWIQEPTETSQHPIRTCYLGHVTSYLPIGDQYFLNRSVPDSNQITWDGFVEDISASAKIYRKSWKFCKKEWLLL
eukprot:sb/3476154/